jgi:hypothetical protein
MESPIINDLVTPRLSGVINSPEYPPIVCTHSHSPLILSASVVTVLTTDWLIVVSLLHDSKNPIRSRGIRGLIMRVILEMYVFNSRCHSISRRAKEGPSHPSHLSHFQPHDIVIALIQILRRKPADRLCADRFGVLFLP